MGLKVFIMRPCGFTLSYFSYVANTIIYHADQPLLK